MWKIFIVTLISFSIIILLFIILLVLYLIYKYCFIFNMVMKYEIYNYNVKNFAI